MSAASDRLARSRAALVAAMSAPDAGDAARDEAAHPASREAGGQGHEGLLARLRRAWEEHPAHIGVEIAGPVLARWAARHPERFLALAALAGAGLVFARPWRWLPAGALAAMGMRAGLKALGLPALLLPFLMRMRPPARAASPP